MAAIAVGVFFLYNLFRCRRTPGNPLSGLGEPALERFGHARRLLHHRQVPALRADVSRARANRRRPIAPRPAQPTRRLRLQRSRPAFRDRRRCLPTRPARPVRVGLLPRRQAHSRGRSLARARRFPDAAPSVISLNNTRICTHRRRVRRSARARRVPRAGGAQLPRHRCRRADGSQPTRSLRYALGEHARKGERDVSAHRMTDQRRTFHARCIEHDGDVAACLSIRCGPSDACDDPAPRKSGSSTHASCASASDCASQIARVIGNPWMQNDRVLAFTAVNANIDACAVIGQNLH